ncbi:MAG: ABC transporter ATP-binding protein [Acidobacteriota bacterium]|nr:ABC transporter ATP-binding protein [Acidobacteriota bacterium]
MSARVEIRNLSRFFSGNPAVRNVTLTLEPGTTTTLVGASGSGKTTLLRCLAGLLPPTSGTVLFDGRDVTSVAAERRGVGLVFQSYALFPHLTVSENLSFGLDVRGVPAAERRDRVGELAEDLGLAGMLDRLPGQISGGERQRVALGRALAYRPVLLLLDEPLAALDPNLAASVRDVLVRAIARERTTALLVTHDRSDALRLGESVALLRAGELEQTGSPEDLYRKPRTLYAATFFGAGAVWEGPSEEEGEASVANTPLGRIPLPAGSPRRVRLILRPEAVTIHGEDGSRGVHAEVLRVFYEGDRSRVTFGAGRFEASADCPPGRKIRPGERIRVTIDPDLVIALDAGGEPFRDEKPPSGC